MWIVSLVGERDLSTAPLVEADLEAMSRSGTGIVLDLSETTFIDSSILRVILDCRSEHFALVVPTGGAVARLFALVGVDGNVETYRSRFVACRAVAPEHRMLTSASQAGR